MGVNKRVRPRMSMGAAAKDKERERERAMRRFPAFETKVPKPFRRKKPEILQLNIGLYCNQACSHCHVDSSPLRTEMMSHRTAERVVELLERTPTINTVDITGGAPELNREFRYLVEESVKRGFTVLDRCNLTVLLEPGQEDLAAFLAENRVHIVASLPCYGAENVDDQRGKGTFHKSIAGLQMLNEMGYGMDDERGLKLDLVYNPNGPFLAPAQEKLESVYKEELKSTFGIHFSNLLCLNNMPLKRYGDYLQMHGQLSDYMKLLVDNFNPEAVDGLMCRNLVSIGWNGEVFDCDFNQQIGMVVRKGQSGEPMNVFNIDSFDLTSEPILLGQHCFGCTAGCGSSCSGATID